MWLLIAYAILLAGSHGIRTQPADLPADSNLETILLPELDNGIPIKESIHLAFIDNHKEGAAVLILPDNRAGSTATIKLVESLNIRSPYRIIAPDLSGLSGLNGDLTDHSFRNQAAYLSLLLDSLSIDSAHVIAYSSSGIVASNWMHSAPHQLKSVTMLSAYGVQELELLGEYYLNRSLYALQVALIWFKSEAIPHFGLFDRSPRNLAYALNWLESDQRPIRAYLGGFKGPVQIIHGTNDDQVSYSSALEHHRILPQSEVKAMELAGHDIPVSHADTLSAWVQQWIERVDSNQVTPYSAVSGDALARSNEPFDPSHYPRAVGGALFVLLGLIALSTLLSEDIAAIGAGLLVARGSLEFDQALAATFVGIFGGDITLYAAGRLMGARIVTYPPFSWLISARKLERGKIWFQNQGTKVVLISRIVPGSRFPTYVAAGVLKAPFWKFVGLFLIGTVIWTPLIVGLSTVMGNQILDLWTNYESIAVYVLVGFIAFIYGMIHVGIPLFSHSGRMRWIARTKRVTKWEYWPRWLFQLPIYVFVGVLMVRFRVVTLTSVKKRLDEVLSDGSGFDPGPVKTNRTIKNASLLTHYAIAMNQWKTAFSSLSQDTEKHS